MNIAPRLWLLCLFAICSLSCSDNNEELCKEVASRLYMECSLIFSQSTSCLFDVSEDDRLETIIALETRVCMSRGYSKETLNCLLVEPCPNRDDNDGSPQINTVYECLESIQSSQTYDPSCFSECYSEYYDCPECDGLSRDACIDCGLECELSFQACNYNCRDE